jgi:DNA-binding GntR family transcriptional regulator
MDTGVHTGPVTPRSLTQVAYDSLKHRLLMGEFPLGRRLGEVALAELLEVSRTPIREALTRLHAEGLIVRLPEGGFSPTAPDLHTVRELYDVRKGLELTALHADDGHDTDQLEALLDDWRQLGVTTAQGDFGADFVLHDEDFHLRLAAASGNQSLTDLLAHVNQRIRFVRMHDFLTADRVQRTIKEHVSITEALLTGDRTLTETRLVRHLGISRRVVERRAAMALSRMVATGRNDR